LLLAQHFLEQRAAKADKHVVGITPAAAQQLLAYDWPGNVRELENTIARAVTLTRFEKIVSSDLPARITARPTSDLVTTIRNKEELPTLNEVEASYIKRVLEGVDGNKTRAARILGLNRRTLYRKVKRLNIVLGD
jgi:two-component system response regulator HydG